MQAAPTMNESRLSVLSIRMRFSRFFIFYHFLQLPLKRFLWDVHS